MIARPFGTDPRGRGVVDAIECKGDAARFNPKSLQSFESVRESVLRNRREPPAELFWTPGEGLPLLAVK